MAGYKIKIFLSGLTDIARYIFKRIQITPFNKEEKRHLKGRQKMEKLLQRKACFTLTICLTLFWIISGFAQPLENQSSDQEKKAEYVKSVIKTFTSGEIIELKKIPDNAFFERLIKDQALHDGIGEEEQRKRMMDIGIMKYAVGLLRDGQISLTEYVNLRPDIHWVEALRMAYVGGGLELSPSRYEFRFRRLSNDRGKTGKVILPNPNKESWTIKINHTTAKEDVNDPEIKVQFELDDVVVITKGSRFNI